MTQLFPAFQPSTPLLQSSWKPPSRQAVGKPLRVLQSHRSYMMCTSTEDSVASTEIPDPPQEPTGPFAAIRRYVKRTNALKAEALRNYGAAVIIAYGMFDAVTYGISFLLALRAYLATGKVLTWNTLPQVLALMWGINNLSRPFRIAGSLALAPLVDRRIVKPVGRFISRLRSGDSAN